MSKKLIMWGGAGCVLLLFSVVVSLSLGAAQIPLSDVWNILWNALWSVIRSLFSGDEIPAFTSTYEQIILNVRLPRIVLAILVGASLSLAGTGFQGVLRNPLAEPYTLGVASGAAVGASTVILFGLQYYWFGQFTIPIVAFVTALCTLWIVIRLSSMNGKFRMETMILAGVVVQAFFGATVSFMVSMSDSLVNEIVFWLMGSLSLRGWSHALLLLPFVFAGSLALAMFARPLNVFALGERQAAHLGVHVEHAKLIVLIVGTLLSAAAVSVSGTIGFVGLVTPHLLRMLVGPDYRLLLPLSAIYGGVYVLWADTLARMILGSVEIPLGVVTAFLGAPFFAWLLIRHKRKAGI